MAGQDLPLSDGEASLLSSRVSLASEDAKRRQPSSSSAAWPWSDGLAQTPLLSRFMFVHVPWSPAGYDQLRPKASRSGCRPPSWWIVWALLLFTLLVTMVVMVIVILDLAVGLTAMEWNAKDSVPAIGRSGAIATEHPTCSTIGLDMLKRGGSAVDGAIASALCIGTVNSFSSGIGGGGFLLIRLPNGTAEFFDFRETAPSFSTETMFHSNATLSRVGGLAVAVPGEIRGFHQIHQKYGRLPWAAIFEPSIRLAIDGFPVTAIMEDRLNVSERFILASEPFRRVFAPQGRLLRQGEMIRRPVYAETLRSIAKDPETFYTGWIAEALVREINENGGIMTREDFANYQPIVRPPLVGFYHGAKILAGPAPSSGPILLTILNILEGYPLARYGLNALNAHRLAESMKFGFALRTELGDLPGPRFEQRVEEIISKDLAALIRRNLTDNATHDIWYYNPKFEPVENAGTTHISVVDSSDMAVSVTSTVNLIFGSKLASNRTGIILNNEMDDFSSPNITNAFGLPPSPANFIRPGKRPLSSCVPTIIERNGDFFMTIGGSGGSKILTATLLSILNVVDFDMNVQQAIDARRFHHQLSPNWISVENGFSREAIQGWRERGHAVKRLKRTSLAVVQAVLRTGDGELHAGADPRKGGSAAAY